MIDQDKEINWRSWFGVHHWRVLFVVIQRRMKIKRIPIARYPYGSVDTLKIEGRKMCIHNVHVFRYPSQVTTNHCGYVRVRCDHKSKYLIVLVKRDLHLERAIWIIPYSKTRRVPYGDHTIQLRADCKEYLDAWPFTRR